MGLTRPRAHQLQDLDYKQAVRAVSTANVNLSGGTPATVDGIALDVGDRILVTAQTSASENGIYEVITVGAGSSGTWHRTVTADEDDEINAGLSVFVTEGTVYGDTQWLLTTDDPITVDTTELTFQQMQGLPGNSFATISVEGQSNIIADAQADVLTVTSGNNIVLTTNASTDSLTIGVSDNISASGTIDVTGNITGGNLVTDGTVTITGTGAMQIPVGTTAQRPSSPTVGMMRFNTDTSHFEGWTGNSWVHLDTTYG